MANIHNIILAALVAIIGPSGPSWTDALCQNLAAGDACGSTDLETCFGYRCVPLHATLECKPVPLSSATVCRETASVCGVDQFCPGPRVVALQGPGNCPDPTGDSDNDGVIDCRDLCPLDQGKQEPGVCGCDTPDIDSDEDGTFDCVDGCPVDPAKIAPGNCGCGHSENECSPPPRKRGGGGFMPLFAPPGLIPLAPGAPIPETLSSVSGPSANPDSLATAPQPTEPKSTDKASGCSSTGLDTWPFAVMLVMIRRFRRR